MLTKFIEDVAAQSVIRGIAKGAAIATGAGLDPAAVAEIDAGVEAGRVVLGTFSTNGHALAHEGNGKTSKPEADAKKK